MVPPASIVVRTADDNDSSSLAGLLSESSGLATTAEQVRNRLNRSRGVEHPVVAELGGQVVGFASVRLVHYLGEDGPYSEVTELFVLERFRRQGVGAALLSDLENRARNAGASGWSVIVGKENEAAMALYRKQGFGSFAIALQKWFSADRPYDST